MPDEQVEPKQEEPQEETPETQTESETKTEGQGESTAEVKEETQQEEVTEGKTEVLPPKVWKIKVDGEESEKTEEELLALAQQGAHYSKKMAAVSDMEKSIQQRAILENVAANDPTIWKMAMARQMGYDPTVVFATPQPPPQEMRDLNPEGYIQAYIAYETQTQQKAGIDRALQQFIATTAQMTNQGLLSKARLNHNLSEDEYRKVGEFLTQRMRPGVWGMYSDQDLEYAVFATLGQDRVAQAKLKTSENLRQKIKQAAKVTPKPISQKPKEVDPKKKADSEFLQFVKDRTGQA